VGHKPRWATTANDRGVVANRKLGFAQVHLARPADKQKAFDDLLAAQYTPGSPLFHQWLTPTQVGERFGASHADLAATIHWLKQQGFTIVAVSNNKTAI